MRTSKQTKPTLIFYEESTLVEDSMKNSIKSTSIHTARPSHNKNDFFVFSMPKTLSTLWTIDLLFKKCNMMYLYPKIAFVTPWHTKWCALVHNFWKFATSLPCAKAYTCCALRRTIIVLPPIFLMGGISNKSPLFDHEEKHNYNCSSDLSLYTQ